jgi:hypothetical protein
MRKTPLRVQIPSQMRERLSSDPFMQICILAPPECEGRNEWNHAFTYAGKRKNELWAILPMCHKHHKEESRYRYVIEQYLRRRIIYFRATEEFWRKYPKSKLFDRVSVR